LARVNKYWNHYTFSLCFDIFHVYASKLIKPFNVDPGTECHSIVVYPAELSQDASVLHHVHYYMQSLFTYCGA